MQIIWFGSYDSLSTVKDTDGLTLTFHRLELRVMRDWRAWQYGFGLLYGYDESSNDAGTVEDAQAGKMWSRRIGPRVWLAWQNSEHARFRMGADMVGIVGDLSQAAQHYSYEPTDNIPQDQRLYDEPPSDQNLGPFAFAKFDNPVYTTVAARNTLGAYAEYGFRPALHWDLELGLRADLWLTGFRGEVGIDPRILLTHYLSSALDLHAALGLAHQPAVFLLPLPGVSDVALDRGLQEAVQSELGAAVDLWGEARFELQLFMHYYTELLFPELAIEKFNQCSQWNTSASASSIAANVCQGDAGFPRATALAYGGEIFLRRPPNQAIAGWLSYTLTWARAKSDEGFEFTPVFDTRHVVNLVLQYRPTHNWRLGGRGHARSGQMYSTSHGFVPAAGATVTRVLPDRRTVGIRMANRLGTDGGLGRVVQRHLVSRSPLLRLRSRHHRSKPPGARPALQSRVRARVVLPQHRFASRILRFGLLTLFIRGRSAVSPR